MSTVLVGPVVPYSIDVDVRRGVQEIVRREQPRRFTAQNFYDPLGLADGVYVPDVEDDEHRLRRDEDYGPCQKGLRSPPRMSLRRRWVAQT